MKKTLGAIAVLGVSILVLAGCTAGTESAEIRVWLVGTGTPQEARDYLIKTFADENPGSSIVIEEQPADVLVDALTTALSSDDGPDIVEFGAAQAPAFTSTGALLDLSDDYDELGGDDLLAGQVEAGTFEGTFFAPPLFAQPRVEFADPALVAAAPATLDEFITTAKALAAGDPGASGLYFAGRDWKSAAPFVWANGGEFAVQQDGAWDAQLSSDASVAGLLQVQDLMMNASLAPRDGDNAEPWLAYCDNQAIQFSAPSAALGPASACASATPPAVPFVYALPGRDGGAAPVLADGSNIGVSAKSEHPRLATKALKLMLSDEFQSFYGAAGLVPAKKSLGSTLGDTPAAAALVAAASGARLTPASPKWADVEASGVLAEFFGQIAIGGDVAALAAAVDTQIEAILNG
jgi:N,N'-diacetylchitobiose transport system substrate-binding protein